MNKNETDKAEAREYHIKKESKETFPKHLSLLTSCSQQVERILNKYFIS